MFQGLPKTLEKKITPAYVGPTKQLYVVTDASGRLWGGVVTQKPISDLLLRCADQRREPLAFLSSHFRDAELRWSTIEKEALVIMATVKRMHWKLTVNKGFDLYTDHNNLVLCFDPTTVIADL